jgi:hypothetical protein
LSTQSFYGYILQALTTECILLTEIVWFLWCDGDVAGSEEMPYWKLILALSIINVPWYGAMVAKHGLTYMHTFFGYHNLEVPADGHCYFFASISLVFI